ncbi:MAG: glycosyltransferase family 2 protein [Patescibacteria group bacterium]
MNSPRVAAIVPAFNEEATIASVVRVLTASKHIDEVLVVSDGSTDQTVARAKEAGATVFDLEQNGGKGNAILHGLSQTSAEVILLADADLRGFSPEHIEQLVAPVISDERKMNVALRDRGAIVNLVSPHLPRIAGERALRREILEHIPPQYLQGYMIESALNFYCRSHRLPYGSVLLKGLSIRHKYEKVGWTKAFKQYCHMSFQVVKAMIAVRLAAMRGNF